MNNKQARSRLQIIAGFQLTSIIIQLAIGIAAVVITSVPASPDQSVNTYNQIVIMLLLVFLVPAIPTLTSARILIRPLTNILAETRVRARKTQQFVFIFCLATAVPSFFLATNGFWVFFADCVLGIISWQFVGKDLKPEEK